MTTTLDDVLFTLSAVCTPFNDATWSPEGVREVLGAFAEFVETEVAPTNASADRTGARLVAGRAEVPAELHAVYAKYVELGWQGLALPEAHGGIGAPDPVVAASLEMLCGANHGFQLLVGLVPGAARAIAARGTPEQAERYVSQLASGEALATMCLTEPGAGSDLSAIRTRATEGADGAWRISGEKIFISGGDQDLTEKIVHLVLARTGAPDEGTRGLSLFVCPSHLADGTRNAIAVRRIEEKMGLHASPTCQLGFTEARGELVGRPGEGLRAMFVMMNHARLEVALQGVGHAAEAHRRAAEYAATRVQGGRPIAEHGDVARMLMHMDALALGGRAMGYRAAEALEGDPDLAEFLTPVVKAWCTDAGSTTADLGMQILGGYGYLPEYGMEQIWRDCRITRIYEGTNGIMAQTLVNRLLTGGDAAYLAAFVAEIEGLIDSGAKGAEAVRTLLADWHAAREAVSSAADPGMAATPFMQLTGLLHFSACWLALEAQAGNAADPDRIARTAHFVRKGLMPESKALAATCIGLAEGARELAS